MSHFAVAVILKDINDLESALAPYQENNMGDCPKQYLEFHSTREENKERHETYKRTMYRKEGILYRSDEDIFKKEIPFEDKDNEIYKGFDKEINYSKRKCYIFDHTGYEEIKIPFTVIWKSFDEFLKDYCQDEWDEEAQDYG